ncbi:hypothetical protein BOW52_02780, partial [Solemya elarraichensis gill symbiont]
MDSKLIVLVTAISTLTGTAVKAADCTLPMSKGEQRYHQEQMSRLSGSARQAYSDGLYPQLRQRAENCGWSLPDQPPWNDPAVIDSTPPGAPSKERAAMKAEMEKAHADMRTRMEQAKAEMEARRQQQAKQHAEMREQVRKEAEQQRAQHQAEIEARRKQAEQPTAPEASETSAETSEAAADTPQPQAETQQSSAAASAAPET